MAAADTQHGTRKPGQRGVKRSAARLGAVQALYQMDIAQTDLSALIAEYEAHRLGAELEGDQYGPADAAFFRDVVEGVVREQRLLDRKVDALLAEGWPLVRLDTIVRAVLRAGGYELMFRRDVPAKAVINEYLDVAHAFLGADETRLINGVLDRMAREARGDEFA